MILESIESALRRGVKIILLPPVTKTKRPRKKRPMNLGILGKRGRSGIKILSRV